MSRAVYTLSKPTVPGRTVGGAFPPAHADQRTTLAPLPAVYGPHRPGTRWAVTREDLTTGAPDWFPTHTAGADAGFRAVVPVKPNQSASITLTTWSGDVYALNDAAIAQHAADVDSYCTPDREMAHTVPALFRTLERERWNGATVAKRTPRTRGGIERATMTTGRARLDNGTVVNLEAEADRWLIAGGFEHDRPDVFVLTVDPFTWLERYEQQARPDRVAWRGKNRYRPRSHRRRTVNSKGRTENMRGTYWQDVTVYGASEYDHVPAAWPIDLDYPPRPWSLVAERTAQVTVTGPAADFVRAAAGLSPKRIRTRKAQREQAVDAGAQTAVYGPVVSPWQASPRSLPRMIDRMSVEQRDQYDSLVSILRDADGAVPLNDHLTVFVAGARVDDGSNPREVLTRWAARAVLAGVMLD